MPVFFSFNAAYERYNKHTMTLTKAVILSQQDILLSPIGYTWASFSREHGAGRLTLLLSMRSVLKVSG